MMGRTLLRSLAENRAFGCAVALVERLDSSHPRILRVLTYHRVDEAAPFARQMAYLAERYHVVSIPRVLQALDGGPALPRRAVLLTFDDAHRSFAEVAWPILRSHAFPAALFVPTAFPDGQLARFWWDRLAEAFARGTRRTPLSTPVGTFPLATPAERAHAHTQVKRYVKDLPHAQTLAATDELCAALESPAERHEVLGWDELRRLARAGVTLGAHTRTHPRLDRVSRSEAREELLGSLHDLEREVPGLPRVFAFPDGRFDDELVELTRAAGVELAFTTRRGTNDLFASDRLRLRRLHVDACDSVAVLRAKLALSAARLAPATRLIDPPSTLERRAERAGRRERRRTRLLLRSLDAALTARLRAPRGFLSSLRDMGKPRSSHYDRIGGVVQLAVGRAPALAQRLERTLLEPARLPVRDARLELAGFGTGATVFRLESGLASSSPQALKIYRRTLGRSPEHLVGAARRYQARYLRLREDFGEVVLPASFLVLHAPLRGVPAVACLQPWLGGRVQDLLALEDGALLALLRQHALEACFAAFVRRALAWRREGSFPDLAGRGNLVVVEEQGRTRLRLIDYGIFHPVDAPASPNARIELETLAGRLESLLGRIGSDVLHTH
jgi:peptidoglycan/xylan/chitin deacetylase (PgdA/CDA1 family)